MTIVVRQSKNGPFKNMSIEEAMEDSSVTYVEIKDGPISATEAKAARNLLLPPKHLRPWTLLLQSSYPENDDSKQALAKSFTAKVWTLPNLDGTSDGHC